MRRCMQKDRRQRLHHIADARLEIREALQGPDDRQEAGGPEIGTPVRKSALLPWLLVAALALRLHRVEEEVLDCTLEQLGVALD